MSKLTDYLRALLARFVSKNETEFISTQSTPSRNGIDLDIPTNNELSYTAPSNGFLNIADEMSNGKMGITSWGVMDATVYSESSSSQGGQDAVYIPMKKGDTQNVIIFGKARFIRFVKMTGGGDKPLHQLLQGGLLCLRNSLKRCLSSQAEWQCPQILLCKSHLQKDRPVILQALMSHQVTVGSMFPRMWESTIATFVRYELKQKYKHVLRYRSLITNLLFGLGVMSQYVKEKLQKSWLSELVQQNRFVSFCQPLALSNLGLGGARC